MPAHKIPRELLESTKWTNESDPTYIKFEKISQVLNNEEDQAVQQLAFNIPAHTSGQAKATGLRITVGMDDGEPTGSDAAHGIRAIMIDELPIAGTGPEAYDYITPMAVRINQGWQVSLRTPDNCDLMVGMSNDCGLRWSEETTIWPNGDATTTDGTMILFVSNNSETLHITDRGGRQIDFGLSDADNPEIIIHKSASHRYSTGTITYAEPTLRVTLSDGEFPGWVANDTTAKITIDGTAYAIASRDSATQLTLSSGPAASITDDTNYSIEGNNLADTGTITYDQPTLAVTLSGATWPHWAANANVSLYISNAWYDVASRDSDTQITLSSGPASSITTGESYVLSDVVSNGYMRIGAHDGSSCRVQSVGADLALYRGTTKHIDLTTSGTRIATLLGPLYAEGLASYDHTGGTSEREVVLAGGTWPAWAAGAYIKLSGTYYLVATRVDGTHLTLGAGDNPGGDVAAGAYSLEGNLSVTANTGAGISIGAAASDLVGFWGTTPVVQPASAAQADMGALTSAAVGDLVATNGGWGYSSEENADKVHTAIDQLVADVTAIDLLLAAIRDALVDVGIIKGGVA